MYFGVASAGALPLSAIIAAISGDDRLVPPTTDHRPCTYTARPDAGSATAAMSAEVRMVHRLSSCQAGFGLYAEQLEPPLRQADSVQPRLAPAALVRVVPPTEITSGSAAGQLGCRNPRSPLAAVTATPGYEKADVSVAVSSVSSPPQLLDTTVAPDRTAVRTAAAIDVMPLSSDSTSSSLHAGQTADAASRSRATSTVQSSSGSYGGSGASWPSWLTLRKQPLAVVHGGRSYCRRYPARSASAVGASWASTTAIVRPAPPVLGSLYAASRSARDRPLGVPGTS